MSLKDHKDFWSTVVSIIAICSTIIGGSYTAIKFWQDSNAERLKQTQDASVERVKQTLVLLDRYQKSPIHEVRIKLENIWTNLEELIDTKANGDKKEFEQFILKVVGDNKL